MGTAGSGYFPPPPTPTRILGPDGVPLTGDVTLSQGNNVGITRVGNALTFVATAPTPLRAVTAFGPGAAVARTLQRQTVTSAILQALDIYLGTAPVGTDGTNHGNVIVKGTLTGGPVVVPLTVGVSEYHLGVGSLTTPLAGSVATGTIAGRAERSVAYGFTVSSTIVVKNLDILFSALSGASNVRAGIATGVTQGVTPVLTPNWITDAASNQCFADITGSNGGGSRPVWTLPGTTGFTLNAGTTYYLVVSMLSNNDQLEITQGTTNTFNGNLNANGPVVTDSFSAGHYTDIFDSASGAIKYPSFNLFGAILGTPLTGLVEIGQTITGAPPGTTGSDANIVAQV